jgi:hypothetical protein
MCDRTVLYTLTDSFINDTEYHDNGTTQAINAYPLPLPSHQEGLEELARRLKKRYSCRRPSLSSEVQSNTSPPSRSQFWMVQVPVSL